MVHCTRPLPTRDDICRLLECSRRHADTRAAAAITLVLSLGLSLRAIAPTMGSCQFSMEIASDLR